MARRAVKRAKAKICFLALFPLTFAAFAVDRPIARFMAGIDPHIAALFDFITWFGQGGVILYPAAAILLAAFILRPRLPSLKVPLTRSIDRAAAIFIVVAAAGLADDALKIVFGRARPRLWLAGDASGFHFFRYGAKFASFPSGHMTTSVAAAIVFGVLFPRYRWFFAAFALLIGASRVVIDAHYLSDVIGGAAIGGIVAFLVLDYLQKRNSLSLPHTQDSDVGCVE